MSAASLPDRIIPTARLSGHPLAGAFFEVELPMTRKNSFRILLGVGCANPIALTRPRHGHDRISRSGPRVVWSRWGCADGVDQTLAQITPDAVA
jgi:hypothetical protein